MFRASIVVMTDIPKLPPKLRNKYSKLEPSVRMRIGSVENATPL
jgi:hypothetical protein